MILCHYLPFALRKDMTKKLWEILVPTVRPNTNGTKFFTLKFHKKWDAKVHEISGGLTVMTPTKGQWVSPSGVLFVERMIPVRIIASDNEIHKIIDMTLEYYEQDAVMCYKISDEVILKYSDRNTLNQS